MTSEATSPNTGDSTKFTFNWHNLDRVNWSSSNDHGGFDEFLSWFLVHLVVPTDENERTSWYDELSERTGKFSNVELKIIVNGVEGNVRHVLESIHANMVRHARNAAVEELRSSSEFRSMKRMLRALEGAVVDRAEQVARGFGLTLHDEEN